MTAHKCQGETLDRVIIDFGPDLKLKIKNYICPGSFYVALTRVREGNKVFLKSFDKSYIQVNKTIEEKIEAMKKFRSYQYKKVYVDDQIFINENNEVKAGYLNINGLTDGNHAEYLNADLNLNNLDILVLAETKLDNGYQSDQIANVLTNWKMIGRYDAQDGSKHMGLMLLTSRKTVAADKIQNSTHQVVNRENTLQIQCLIISMANRQKFGFVYCRSTPNTKEIKAMRNFFQECNILMGDFNLSHKSS